MSSHSHPPDGGDWHRPDARHQSGPRLSDSEVAQLAYGNQLDGTLSGTTESSTQRARTHVEACEACRQRVADALSQDRTAARLLSTLDVPAPVFDIESVLVRTHSYRAGNVNSSHPRVAPPQRYRHYAIAASFLFVVIGVTALAFPGSPLRRMVERFHRPEGSDSIPVVLNAKPGTSETVGSVSIVPAAHLTIEFRGIGTVLPALTVRYCDTALASLSVIRQSLRGSIGAGSGLTGPAARFAVSADRIVVTPDSERGAHADVYQLMIPDTNRTLTLTASGSVLNVQRPQLNSSSNSSLCDPPINIVWTR